MESGTYVYINGVHVREVDCSRFDPDGAGDPAGSVFGLPYTADECSVVLVPVPWEATVSYGRGTAAGPRAIREASAQLDLFDPELAGLGLARPWRFGLHMLPECSQVQEWNAQAERARDLRNEVNRLGAKLDAWVKAEVETWREAGKIVGVVGGDHSSAWGSIAAVSADVPQLGVLHIDAHADLRVAYEGFRRSHASVMHNVLQETSVSLVVQVGIRDLSAAEYTQTQRDPKVITFFDHERDANWISTVVARLPERVYITFDIDGLDPACCPHTGTPVPGGLSFREAMRLLAAVAASGRRIEGFDLVEVAPPVGTQPLNDPAAQWDGNVGARALYRLCGAALLSQGARDAPDGPGL